MTKKIILASLILVSGLTGLGFSLITKFLQLQQLKQANQLLAQKNYQSAIAAYDKLLQTNIGQRENLWLNRGYAWSKLQNYNEMLQSCSAATIVDTQTDLGWNCRGEALYHLGQYEEALQAFKQATSINPRESTYWLNESRALFKLKHYDRAFFASDQAIKFLKQKVEDKADKPRRDLAIAFNQKGQSLLRKGQFQQALAAFDRSIKNSATYLSARQGKAIALYKLGHHNQAVAAFDRILQRHALTNNQEATIWLYKGICLCDAEKLTEADRAFKQVLQLSSDSQYHKLAQAGCGIR
ncbi:tetratricopeptide repeat protein [Pleurocapsa sp. PCC 7319]|uniref:tetratricopeptide repeat protein n=1 Tax=Pleurocapsa sp. PCC 7319 TaxID=118161 RepID=UPI00130E12F6|nr:tetratricopeptide repeat protein [Pleurocapsa sp. PCC 7319]